MARSPDATRELYHRLTQQARYTSRTPDAEQVHNLRVAIRRFNQALDLHDEDTPGFRKIHRRLKKTMALAGQVRDADIARKLVGKLQPAGAGTIQAKLAHRRMESEEQLVAALPALAKNGHFEMPASAGKLTQDAIHDAIRDAVKRLFKRAAKADDARGLHRLRIAAKKLRYALELLAPRHDRLEQMKRLQALLGDINDYETARRIVAEESGGKKLLAQLEDRQSKKIREFRRYWKSRFDGDDNARRWMADLSHTRKSAAGA
ncbi:MAG TPA: CHAD domain-containing protein [Bryobacteraceae bacterium]|nr:CHAD domain-containing protein [Bryobacteraceae bacterium]